MLKNILSRFFPRRSEDADHGDRDTPIPPASPAAMAEALRCYKAGDYAAAEASAGEAVRIDPRLHQAWNLLAAIAAATEKYAMAVRHFERAIELAPANAGYLSNCGEVCRRAGWLDDAIEHCRGALAVEPDHANAHYNLALALHAIGEVEQAHAALTRALALRPDALAPRSALLFMLGHLPGVDDPTLMSEHHRWNELHARALAPRNAPLATSRAGGRKLRVGYLSADFRQHALFYFIEPIFAHHNRAQFDVYCYSNTLQPDQATAQLRNHVPLWRDIARLSDDAAARLIEEDRIDVLVDLSGHTAGNRLLVFARKPAPVQISYIGFPNTTGLATVDYRISDGGYMDPPGVSEGLYTEKLLRMPHNQWCYRPPAATPDVNRLPALTRGVTTFGSFHSFTKLNRHVIDLWARLLARQPAAELLIAVAPPGEARAQVCAQFAARGIAEARLQFVGKLNFEDFLALYNRVDIALDTFPCPGGTTTCEALWMGVPVVTLAGKYGVARAGGSLLRAAGLAELIADGPGQYLDIASGLASDPRRLADLRASLRARLQRSALMDEAAVTRAFEALLIGAFDTALTTPV